MSQLERRLTEEIATAIGKFERMKESYDREVAERKKMTEMYLEANQACIDAESKVAVLMVDNNDLKSENSDLEFRVDQYRRFMDHHFSKEPTGFDDWRREFTAWVELQQQAERQEVSE